MSSAAVLPESVTSAGDLAPGVLVSGKYRIEKLLGRGGMGAVYHATNVAIRKQVALKFLCGDAANDSEYLSRFQREAEAVSAVESEHIAAIYDSGRSEDGTPFLVLELLRGQDLRARLGHEYPLTVAEVLELGLQVCRALERTHAAGIVHRDLKPENLFLCNRDDDRIFVKVLDFGVSKIHRPQEPSSLTQRGVVLGTAYYMAPEQAQGLPDVDGRADLYSLGAILYECLAGRPPHEKDSYEALLIALCTVDPVPLTELRPELPREVWDLVARALSRDRATRFQSAQEFALALRRLLELAGAPFLATGGHLRRESPSDPALAHTDVGPSLPPVPLPSRKLRRSWLLTAIAVGSGAALMVLWALARPPSSTGSAARVDDVSPLPSARPALPAATRGEAADEAEQRPGAGGPEATPTSPPPLQPRDESRERAGAALRTRAPSPAASSGRAPKATDEPATARPTAGSAAARGAGTPPSVLGNLRLVTEE